MIYVFVRCPFFSALDSLFFGETHQRGLGGGLARLGIVWILWTPWHLAKHSYILTPETVLTTDRSEKEKRQEHALECTALSRKMSLVAATVKALKPYHLDFPVPESTSALFRALIAEFGSY